MDTFCSYVYKLSVLLQSALIQFRLPIGVSGAGMNACFSVQDGQLSVEPQYLYYKARYTLLGINKSHLLSLVHGHGSLMLHDGITHMMQEQTLRSKVHQAIMK